MGSSIDRHGSIVSRKSQIKMRRKKNVKKGIQFCLMVCGASGTGRTTFVNTLCGKRVLQSKDSDDPERAHLEEGVRIKPITVELELDEEGTRISLTIVDTPGFGDQIDNEQRSAESEHQYVDHQADRIICTASPRLLDILSANMMTFSQKNLVSSVTPGSEIIVSMLFSTLSRPLVTGMSIQSVEVFGRAH